MFNPMGIECISRQFIFRGLQYELIPGHKPQQVSFAAAVTTVAFYGLGEIAGCLETYIAAVTASDIFHDNSPK